MKAKIKATATLRAGTGDLTYFGQFHRGEEVDIITNCNADSADIYNTPGGSCFLCRRSNGTMSYALATDLEIIDYAPSIDWEARRYELAKAAMQGFMANTDLFDRFEETGDTIMCLCPDSIAYADEMISLLKGETRR